MKKIMFALISLLLVLFVLLVLSSCSVQEGYSDVPEPQVYTRKESVSPYNGVAGFVIGTKAFEGHTMYFFRFGEGNDMGMVDSRKVEIVENYGGNESYFYGEFMGNGVDFFPLNGVLYLSSLAKFQPVE